MKQYYPFIDVAKGVGIMAVMMAHCGTFVFFTSDDITHHAISTFFMPLFFLASGFVNTRLLTERLRWRELLVAKNYYLLIPFLVSGSIYVAVSDYYQNGSFTVVPTWKLLTSEANYGYWFVLVLFLYRFIVISGKLIFQEFEDRIAIVRHWCLSEYARLILPLIVMLPLWMGGVVIFKGRVQFLDFPYFLLGAYIHMFNWHNTILRNDKVQAFLFVLAAVLFCYKFYLNGHGGTLLRFCATISMFGLILRANLEHPFVRFFSSVGKISLDIYVLHYFFLLTFGHPGYFPDGATQSLPLLLQLTSLVGMSLLLIAGSWIVSKAIHLNSFLTFLLLGRK